MTNTPELISLCGGKYSVKNNNGVLEVYRHGERWPEKEKQLIGDGFVLALVQEIEELKEKLGLQRGNGRLVCNTVIENL